MIVARAGSDGRGRLRGTRTLRSRSILLGALLCCGSLATGAGAAEARLNYAIPAQRADAALREFARQSGLQILFPYEQASSQTAPALQGPFTVAEALATLTRSAGLVVAFREGRTIALVAAPTPRADKPPERGLLDALLGRRPRQARPPPVITEPAAQVELLGEIVVTATRQADLLNRVPLSVTAISQRSLDQGGVKNVQDLARTVGAVTFRRTNAEANPSIAIRGVSSLLGAPTTGVYLDDTPLHKRDNAGSATGNGTPFPQLFDLERVEILRGPQGTLFGSSAEGGAVRFITPQPSLTNSVRFGRAEVSTTREGGASYEGGVVVGGPLLEDRLGFRLSVFGRHTAGYIDQVSIYDGHVVAKDVNAGNLKTARLALTWAPNERLRITPAMYWSTDHVSAQDVFWEDIPQFSLNGGTFTNAGTVNGVRFDFPDKAFPGGTFGPYDQYGPYRNGTAHYLDDKAAAEKQGSPRTTRLYIPTLTIDYELGAVSVKSITSVLGDRNKGYTGGLFGIRTAVLPTTTNAGFVDAAGTPVPGGAGAAPIIFPGKPTQFREFSFFNTRHGVVQELRFVSAPDRKPLSWVAGVFYSNTNQHQFTYSPDDENLTTLFLRGIDEAWLLGQTNFAGGNSSQRDVHVDETEIAGFGEATYALTPTLRLTAGVRFTRSEVTFKQSTGSSVQGAPPSFVGTPGPPAVVTDPQCGRDPKSCNSASFHPFPNLPADDMFVSFQGVQSESPLTPKFGLTYQPAERRLYYVTVAKGFRSGGLNQPVPRLTCVQDLVALGLDATPLTFKSDSVWSYEAGAKLGLLGGRAQINSSAFYVDWRDPQLQNRLRCGQNYTVNAGHAVSKGFDVQAQARLGPATLNASVAYTDARYVRTYAIPGAGDAPIVIVNRGDALGAPRWQLNLGAQYDFRLASGVSGYFRADYQHSSRYLRGMGPGAAGYDPVIADGAATNFVAARAGVIHGPWEFSLFVNNLTNSKDRLAQAHQTQSALVTSMSFRPREIGLQATVRY